MLQDGHTYTRTERWYSWNFISDTWFHFILDIFHLLFSWSNNDLLFTYHWLKEMESYVWYCFTILLFFDKSEIQSFQFMVMLNSKWHLRPDKKPKVILSLVALILDASAPIQGRRNMGGTGACVLSKFGKHSSKK